MLILLSSFQCDSDSDQEEKVGPSHAPTVRTAGSVVNVGVCLTRCGVGCRLHADSTSLLHRRAVVTHSGISCDEKEIFHL